MDLSMSDTPTFPAYATKTRYVFTWTISSLSRTTQNVGLYVDSPHFATADGGVWTIRLYPIGVNYFCSLLRWHDKAAPLVLYYDVDFLPEMGNGQPSYTVKAEPFGIGHMLAIPREIVSLDSATSDFLALQFRLKKSRSKGPRGVLMVSEIQVERSSAVQSFKETMKEDDEDEDEIERLFINRRLFGVGENRVEEFSQEIFPTKIECSGLGYAVVALNRSRTKQWGKSRIHLLNKKGRVHVTSEVGEHFFRNDSLDLFRYHNLLTAEQVEIDKHLLRRGGLLNIIFEIETSDGKLSSERCRKIYNDSYRVTHHSLKDDAKRFFHVLKDTDLQFRVGEGKKCFAHRAVVSVRSPVFRTMLKSDMLERGTGVVDVEGIEFKTFSRLMRFIYTATFDPEADCEDVANLYAAADRYSIVSLKRMCSSILKSRIAVDNCCYLLMFSDLHQDDELKDIAEFFIFTHYDDVAYSSDWKFMEEKCPQMAETVLEKRLEWHQKISSNEETDS